MEEHQHCCGSLPGHNIDVLFIPIVFSLAVLHHNPSSALLSTFTRARQSCIRSIIAFIACVVIIWVMVLSFVALVEDNFNSLLPRRNSYLLISAPGLAAIGLC